MEAVKADGSSLKLSDFRGKYLLLSMVYDYGNMMQPQPAELLGQLAVLRNGEEPRGSRHQSVSRQLTQRCNRDRS